MSSPNFLMRVPFLVVVIALLGSAATSLAGTNTQLHTGTGVLAEVEVMLQTDPTDPQHMVAAGHTYRIGDPEGREINTFHTANGGLTWTLVPVNESVDSLSSVLRFDPTLAIDGFGDAWFAYLAAPDSLGNCSPTRLPILWCPQDSGGFQKQFELLAPEGRFIDKPMIATAPIPANPGTRVYVAYSEGDIADCGNQEVDRLSVVAFDSYGLHELAQEELSSTGSFGMPQPDRNGDLWVIWIEDVENPTHASIRVAKIDQGDGGDLSLVSNTTLGYPGYSQRYITSAADDRGINPSPSLAIDRRATGTYAGRIYAVYGVKTGQDTDALDVVVQYNDGSGWSSPRLVHKSDDSAQFLPWVSVDQSSGAVAVVFYDTRHDATNVTAHTYLAVSTDGGDTWSEKRISGLRPGTC